MPPNHGEANDKGSPEKVVKSTVVLGQGQGVLEAQAWRHREAGACRA